jgi:hypothetical protein
MSLSKIASLFLLAACFVSLTLRPTFATGFAVLLGGCDTNGDGSCGSSDKLEVKNPLYEESGNKGVNPLYEAKTDLLIFSPPDITSGSPVELHFAFSSSISVSVPPVPGRALVFELDIVDTTTGQKLTNFPNLVNIGFSVPKLAHLHKEGIGHRDLAFRYLNTSVSPPVWETQSAVTSKDGLFCGTTDHFSIFAFGAVPEPSSMMLLLGGSLGLLWRRTC